ncbi:MAG: hypothetical protein ABW046_04060 [Actinoplanes sp.]
MLIPTPPRWLLGALLFALGAGGGLAYDRLTQDPHSATAEQLTGTVTWSNAETRMIAFEADGEVRDPLLGDTMYHVVGEWEDATGTILGTDFPACLAGPAGDPVSTQRRRISIDAIHRDYGGPQKMNVAVYVRCG